MRNCPRLKKFFIPEIDDEELEDWQRKICEFCILEELCVLDIKGKVPPDLIKKLKESSIPCPSCQKDPVRDREIKLGLRSSGLIPDGKGWRCRFCGFVILKVRRRKWK